MKRFSNEIKAGILILVGIAVCIMFFLKTSNIQTKTYDLKTYFKYAGDINNDAVVKLSGIEVGRLEKINIVYDPETKVECILKINTDARVREDSIAYIAASGFMGDTYVGLTPGASDTFLKNGDTVASEDPVQMRLLMKKADSIAQNLDATLAEVKSLVVDNRENLDDIVLNLEATTENFKEFSEDVKRHPWKLLFKGE
jgi:phospholipid/cholesterol/gamma-HCH transport system substrate-binding protein